MIALLFTKNAVSEEIENLIENKKGIQKRVEGISVSESEFITNKLKSIKDFEEKEVQPINNFNVLYDHSIYAQMELENILNSASKESDSEAVFSGIKNKERARNKINSSLNGKAEEITDIVRGTLIADNISDIINNYEYINKNSEVVQVKNRFNNPEPSGYRDIKILIRLPESKIIAEVQIHIRAIAKIKSGAEHDVYEIIQSMERNARLEKRELTFIEKTQIKSARNESSNLYKKAWELYLPINSSTAI